MLSSCWTLTSLSWVFRNNDRKHLIRSLDTVNTCYNHRKICSLELELWTIYNPYLDETESYFSLCHQYRARPVCTSMQSDQALYCWLTSYQVIILISLKMIMDSSKFSYSVMNNFYWNSLKKEFFSFSIKIWALK